MGHISEQVSAVSVSFFGCIMGPSVKIILLAVILVNFVWCKNENIATSDNDVATQLVQTNSGAIRGEVLQTLRHKLTYYSFKGIPYAKVPIGDLRFKVSAFTDSNDL